jgi:hypothetical protein
MHLLTTHRTKRASSRQTCLRPQCAEINTQRQRPPFRHSSFSPTIYLDEHTYVNTHVSEFHVEASPVGRVKLSGDDFTHDSTFGSQGELLVITEELPPVDPSIKASETVVREFISKAIVTSLTAKKMPGYEIDRSCRETVAMVSSWNSSIYRTPNAATVTIFLHVRIQAPALNSTRKFKKNSGKNEEEETMSEDLAPS